MAEKARLYLMLTGASGPIKGESKVLGMRDWIEIDAWDWEIDPDGDRDDRQAIRPSVLSFSKQMDRASTGMLSAMTKGDLLTATIRLDDASLQMFDLKLELQKVRVVSYEMRSEVADKHMSIEEQWAFDYDSMSFDYRPDGKSGAMQVRLVRPPGSSTRHPGRPAPAREKSR